VPPPIKRQGRPKAGILPL